MSKATNPEISEIPEIVPETPRLQSQQSNTSTNKSKPTYDYQTSQTGTT